MPMMIMTTMLMKMSVVECCRVLRSEKNRYRRSTVKIDDVVSPTFVSLLLLLLFLGRSRCWVVG